MKIFTFTIHLVPVGLARHLGGVGASRADGGPEGEVVGADGALPRPHDDASQTQQRTTPLSQRGQRGRLQTVPGQGEGG